MNIDTESLRRLAFDALPVLLDAAAKGLVLLAVAGVLVLAMRKASAAARQVVWLLALAALIALPLASAALPSWGILPGWVKIEIAEPAEPVAADTASHPGAGEVVSLSPDPLRGADQADAHAVAPPSGEYMPAGAPSGLAVALEPAPHADGDTAPTAAFTAKPTTPVRTWRSWIIPLAVAAWLVGAMACLLPLILGRISLWRLARRSRRIDVSLAATKRPGTAERSADGSGDGWATLLNRAAQAIGLRRPITLLQSNDEPMPMVWGTLRPKLLLPAEAEGWSVERRWVVLLHELAHAKRRDCLAKLIAHVACACYWFNPLCWIAFKLMQREAEAACDDLVLNSTAASADNSISATNGAAIQPVRPSDYAQHLLEIASGLKSGMLAGYSSIAMARKSKLEGRLLAILDATRNRRALTRISLLVVATLVVAIAVPLACMTATTERSSSDSACKAVNGVFECTIIVGSDPTSYISLATGQPLEMPIEARNPSDSVEWAARNEALTWSAGDTVGLAGFDMVANPLPSKAWDEPSILGQPGTVKDNLSHAKLGSPALFVTGQSNFPATFAFKTRTGRVGLLQLTAYDRESRVLKFRFMSLPGLPLDASGRKFPAFVIFINNKRYGPTNGSSLVPPKGGVQQETGRSTCGHPGAVSEVEWKYLRTIDTGDEYEVTRRFPIDTATPSTEKKTVTYSGDLTTIETVWRALPAEGRDRWILLVPGKMPDEPRFVKLAAESNSAASQPETRQRVLRGADLSGTWSGERNDVTVTIEFYGKSGAATWRIQAPGATIAADLKLVEELETGTVALRLDYVTTATGQRGSAVIGRVEETEPGGLAVAILPAASQLESDYPSAMRIPLQQVAPVNWGPPAVQATEPAGLSPELLRQRDALLAQADKQIRAGLAQLAEDYPQLKKEMRYWSNIARPSEQGQVSIWLYHTDQGKAATAEQMPAQERVIVAVHLTKPPAEPAQQGGMIYPGLGLFGQLRVSAGDPKLDAALKELVADAVAPLATLEGQVALDALGG